MIRSPEPSYDMGAVAMGVALTNAPYDVDGHNLAREITPALTISDIFPWGELAVQGVLLGAVSLFLMGTAAETEGRLKATAVELKASSWLKDQTQAKLATEKAAIEDRQKTISAFRNSRVAWSMPLRTIAAAAPDDTVLMTLSGVAELDSANKSTGAKAKKQLVMSFTTPLSEDGSVPAEIDGFLTTLRGEPAIKRNFPLIEISGLQANVPQAGKPSARILQRDLSAQDRSSSQEAGTDQGRRQALGRLTNVSNLPHQYPPSDVPEPIARAPFGCPARGLGTVFREGDPSRGRSRAFPAWIEIAGRGPIARGFAGRARIRFVRRGRFIPALQHSQGSAPP